MLAIHSFIDNTFNRPSLKDNLYAFEIEDKLDLLIEPVKNSHNNKIQNYYYHKFSLERISNALQVACCSKFPIISVGSGNGELEYRLSQRKEFANNKFYCVDPNPESYNPYNPTAMMKPDFPYVSDLIQQHPELVGNCTLLLGWADPSEDYDFEAIQLLKPMSIISIAENEGGAGGQLFHDWCFKNNYDDKEPEYTYIGCKTKFKYGMIRDLNLTLEGWLHSSIPFDDSIIIDSGLYEDVYEEDMCYD
jgi:hypothetical protein